jgi:hypothetical protein
LPPRGCGKSTARVLGLRPVREGALKPRQEPARGHDGWDGDVGSAVGLGGDLRSAVGGTVTCGVRSEWRAARGAATWRRRRTVSGRGRGEPRRKSAVATDELWSGVVLGIGAMGPRDTATRPAGNDRPDARAVGMVLLRSLLAEG